MDEKQLVEYLKKNLKLDIDCEYDSCGRTVTIKIKLDGEEITSESFRD